MRRPSLFKKCDAKRAIEAVQAAGLPVASFEITKEATIRVIPSKPAEVSGETQANEWDEVLNDAPSASVR